MKTLVTFLIIFNTTIAMANNSYEKTMKTQIELLDSAKSREELIATANAFERIAQTETKEWLPLYYAGLAYVYLGFDQQLELKERDAYFAKAEALAKNAADISANNSEITTLQGFALMGKLSADASSRGQSLSPQVMQLFSKAISQNPQNARALYLMAQMEMGMARFFGSNNEKACGMLQQSVALFANQKEAEGIAPQWGEKQARAVLQQCQQEANAE